mmetsp:Transcript_31411/g.82058  ORF Transcript_31411/g.82058 Transcript_31411/m.82058 type:complete len:333 (-) Transcript_31411:722-1720(-)
MQMEIIFQRTKLPGSALQHHSLRPHSIPLLSACTPNQVLLRSTHTYCSSTSSSSPGSISRQRAKWRVWCARHFVIVSTSQKLCQHVECMPGPITRHHVPRALHSQECKRLSCRLVLLKVASDLPIRAAPLGPLGSLVKLQPLRNPSSIAHVRQDVVGVTIVDEHLQLSLLCPLLIAWQLGLIVEVIRHIPTVRPLASRDSARAHANCLLHLRRVQVRIRVGVNACGEDWRDGGLRTPPVVALRAHLQGCPGAVISTSPVELLVEHKHLTLEPRLPFHAHIGINVVHIDRSVETILCRAAHGHIALSRARDVRTRPEAARIVAIARLVSGFEE